MKRINEKGEIFDPREKKSGLSREFLGKLR